MADFFIIAGAFLALMLFILLMLGGVMFIASLIGGILDASRERRRAAEEIEERAAFNAAINAMLEKSNALLHRDSPLSTLRQREREIAALNH